MIIYKQRPDTIPVRIDTVAKTVTNVVNKPDQKILGFMNSEDYSKDWLKTFVETTIKLDKMRNQNIIDIVPQYKELFNEKKDI